MESVSATGNRGTQALTGVSLQVRTGEILGVAGVAGMASVSWPRSWRGSVPLPQGR